LAPGGPAPRPPRPDPIPPQPPRPPRPPLHLLVPSERVVITRSYSDSIGAQVQRKLKKLGYYNGTVDGEIGPRSRAAIRAYQEENGLEITGQIDRALLGSLAL
jgi:peptidoglycan hydrolase-like protein with peptidoglycan-binding domain